MKIEDKAGKIYREIQERISDLVTMGNKRQELLVALERTDVIIDDFWARAFENCVVGVSYQIKNQEGKILLKGKMPLHKAPWGYQRASQEAHLITEMVARELSNPSPHLQSDDVVALTTGNRTDYESLAPSHPFSVRTSIINRFLPQPAPY